jgi:hypothetical protein
MKVQLTTNVIDDIVGHRVTLNLKEGACFRNLMDKLSQDYGKGIRGKLVTKGKLKPHITILVNGQTWSFSDFEKELPQPCEVCIIQLLSGG